MALTVLVGGLVVRAEVQAQRQDAFRSLFQAQSLKAYDALQAQAATPPDKRSLTSVEAAAELSVPSVSDRSFMTFSIGPASLAEPTQMIVLTGSAFFDGPWWLGDQYLSVSTAIFLTYTDVDGRVSIDSGGCTIDSTGVDWAAATCTPEQRSAAWVR